MKTEFVGQSRALTGAGIAAAAASLGTTAREIWTLIGVETSGCGFLADRRPQILFERHVFHRLTGGRFDDDDISAATPGGYGASGAHQYERLGKAALLDRAAAIQSASWGLGQLMGENCIAGCFPNAEAMASAMADSEDAQLQAVVSFILRSRVDQALRSHDWSAFAAKYNGPAYSSHQYDRKLAGQFEKYSNCEPPDLNVRAAQLYLTFGGYGPGPVDGVPGARTQAAVREFQMKHHLPVNGEADEALPALILAAI